MFSLPLLDGSKHPDPDGNKAYHGKSRKDRYDTREKRNGRDVASEAPGSELPAL